MNILVINPGSTSTKLAVYRDGEELFSASRVYSRDVLRNYDGIYGQLELRVDDMMKFLEENRFDPAALDGIAARGGMMPPLRHGAYVLDERMIHVIRYEYAGLHGSNLAGLMAYSLTQKYGIPAWIYDAVSVDEMIPEARPSGIKEWPRKSFSHALNTRAVAMRHAEISGRNYCDVTYIIAHLGGGISLNIQHKGRLIDTVAGQEGPFSTERAGGLDVFDCAAICEKEGAAKLRKYESGEGGFVSYLGTNDARAVADMVAEGDEEAALLMRAMGLQIAKAIASLAPDVNGQVDGILLTGGMAYWKELCAEVQKRVEFIAPVHIYAGEFEMKALAQGIERVLRGQEKAHVYGEEERG